MASSEKSVFDPRKRKRHRHARLEDDRSRFWPRVETPVKQWHYALEYPVAHRFDAKAPVAVSVDLTVLDGEVGIGCMAPHNKFLCETFREANDGRTTATLVLENFSQCHSLMIRNASDSGRSMADIHAITVSDASELAPPLLVLNAETFSRFGTWSGNIPPGFFGDWLGVLTRADVYAHSNDPQVGEALRTERTGTYPPPTPSELLLDWEPLLEAEELAGSIFTAVALGAGWGRWIVSSAFAAMKRGRDYYIVGVEAEPQHFSWMERHLTDNSIPREKARLIKAAVNSYTGTCWFMVGNATEMYGQSVVSDVQYSSAEFQQAMQASGVQAVETPCVNLQEVFEGLERVDYLHMDVQGSEANVLLVYPDLVDERVAVVNIGTHSELIERRLRAHFGRRAWLCRYDIPMNSTIMACLDGQEAGPITVGDGVQVWENPRLTKREHVDSFVVPTWIRG